MHRIFRHTILDISIGTRCITLYNCVTPGLIHFVSISVAVSSLSIISEFMIAWYTLVKRLKLIIRRFGDSVDTIISERCPQSHQKVWIVGFNLWLVCTKLSWKGFHCMCIDSPFSSPTHIHNIHTRLSLHTTPYTANIHCNDSLRHSMTADDRLYKCCSCIRWCQVKPNQWVPKANGDEESLCWCEPWSSTPICTVGSNNRMWTRCKLVDAGWLMMDWPTDRKVQAVDHYCKVDGCSCIAWMANFRKRNWYKLVNH